MEQKEKVQKSLAEKIQENKERLSSLLSKKENIEREIANLSLKINNQEFALKNTKKID